MARTLNLLRDHLDEKIEVFGKLAENINFQLPLTSSEVSMNKTIKSSSGVGVANLGDGSQLLQHEHFYAEKFADMKIEDMTYDAIEKIVVMNEDSKACDLIAEKIEDSERRNLDSALKALELSIQQCEELLSYKVESSGLVIEATIPMLQNKIAEHKLELEKSHDSRRLLEASVRSHYYTMRDGYQHLINQVYHETNAQANTISNLQARCLDWHLDKIQSVIDEEISNSVRQAKKQEIFNNVDAMFKAICDRAFDRLEQDDTFDKREELLLKISEVQDLAYQWKADIVDESEERLNNAEIAIDAYYISHVEELTDYLSNLQSCHEQLYFYDKKLTSLLKLIEVRDHAIQRRAQHQRADLMIQMGRNTSTQMRHPPLLTGTRLKAMALSCGMSMEEIEKLLLHFV